MKKIMVICLMLITSAMASDKWLMVEEDLVAFVELIDIETRQGIIRVRNVEEKIKENDFLDKVYGERFFADKKQLVFVMRPTLIRKPSGTQVTDETDDICFAVKNILDSISFLNYQIDRDIFEHHRLLGY